MFFELRNFFAKMGELSLVKISLVFNSFLAVLKTCSKVSDGDFKLKSQVTSKEHMIKVSLKNIKYCWFYGDLFEKFSKVYFSIVHPV